jgi:hypothetical protein
VAQPTLQIEQLRSLVREVVAPDKGNCRRLRKKTAVSDSFTFLTTRFETDDRLNLSGDTPVNDQRLAPEVTCVSLGVSVLQKGILQIFAVHPLVGVVKHNTRHELRHTRNTSLNTSEDTHA